MTSAAPPAAPVFRNSRRFRTGAVVMTHLEFFSEHGKVWSSGGLGFASRCTGGAMDGFANALIGTAAADVAAHEVVDIGVGGMGLLGQQGDCGHNLAGLAIAALRNVF